MESGLAIYPRLIDSNIPWIGELPEHWELKRGKQLFVRVQRPISEKDEVVTCFRDGVVTLRKNRRLSGFTESLKEIGYQRVHTGDLVIHAMDAFAGAIGVSDSFGKCSPVYVICEPLEELNTEYYALLLREMARTQWIAALAKGIRERSTDFRFETFKTQLLPQPPYDEQNRIVAFVKEVDRKVDLLLTAYKKLVGVTRSAEERKASLVFEYRTRLVSDAVMGGIDVRNYSIQFPSAEVEPPTDTLPDENPLDGEESTLETEGEDL